jgi:hypothetical protein
MKTVYFEHFRNEWYMPIKTNGCVRRAYLGIYWEDNKDAALKQATEVVDALCSVPHVEESIPSGLLLDEVEDFRALISD